MNRSRVLTPALLATLIGSLTTTPAAHAYSTTSPEWDQAITLKLADGCWVVGHYRGSQGSATTTPSWAGCSPTSRSAPRSPARSVTR